MMFTELMLAKRVLMLPKGNKYIPAKSSTLATYLEMLSFTFIKTPDVTRLLLCNVFIVADRNLEKCFLCGSFQGQRATRHALVTTSLINNRVILPRKETQADRQQAG